jgi:3-hydroxybutyryl-CoA dehydrogenase
MTAIGRCATREAIIGTNSSTLPSSMFVDAVPNVERLLNIHFMNPALVMPLVEVVRGAHTSDATVATAMGFARAIGKAPILVERETFGFVANRILFIAMQEAFGLVENGYVSIEDCDAAVRDGLGWPMGPFAIADLVGLDVVEAILEEGHRQTGEERWAPPQLLRERIARGELGRKSGRGFTLGD